MVGLSVLFQSILQTGNTTTSLINIQNLQTLFCNASNNNDTQYTQTQTNLKFHMVLYGNNIKASIIMEIKDTFKSKLTTKEKQKTLQVKKISILYTLV